MKTLNDYTVVVMPDDGTFYAFVPAIRSCHAVGKTPEEARTELGYVFEMIVEEYAEKRRELPDDIKRPVLTYAAAKAREFERAARRLGFLLRRQRGSHARREHPDGRVTTIPVHPRPMSEVRCIATSWTSSESPRTSSGA